jgi:hypothetical protein
MTICENRVNPSARSGSYRVAATGARCNGGGVEDPNSRRCIARPGEKALAIGAEDDGRDVVSVTDELDGGHARSGVPDSGLKTSLQGSRGPC